ncbi:MBOAT family protein [Oesophagostomum dentatum]|uniref:MBOAT family protein n=1 Tax=Oesophagostomum dentatum TaxID=61180 RepID=A0A0B1TMB9_OESDE|nr:MBOAT family protein [Oesophagostomum dentatum]
MSVDRFVPVPLPRWESRLCWLVWILHSGAAFYIAVKVSQGELSLWIEHWLTNSSYVEGGKMDLSDIEWDHFRNTVVHSLTDYCLHSIRFFLITRYVEPKWVKLALFGTGILLQLHMTSPTCVLILAAFAFVVTSLSVITRSIALPWIMCISFVLKASDVVPFTMDNHVYYREFNIYLYGAIKILNFSLYLCQNKDKRYLDVWQDHLVYLIYLPYSMTLIVLYDDFVGQLDRRLSHRSEHYRSFVDLRSVAWFGARLVFWYFAFEFMLHFIYVHSLFNSPFAVIHRLSTYEKCAVAYVTGQLFHVKYVVLFGFPALFAYIDGLQPPPPPTCISRVAHYSQMWRHFDVGLYRFLKNQVYIPLLRKELPISLAIIRNLGTLTAVFGVVLAWHGLKMHYMCWVLLSASELIMERIGRVIWNTSSFQDLRHAIGDLNTRRLVAVATIPVIIPGVGLEIFNSVLVTGVKEILSGIIYPFSTGFIIAHMAVLGYFFSNVCLQFEETCSARDKDLKRK